MSDLYDLWLKGLHEGDVVECARVGLVDTISVRTTIVRKTFSGEIEVAGVQGRFVNGLHRIDAKRYHRLMPIS
jgi:hypothetical protein